jgi:hypothetical protein
MVQPDELKKNEPLVWSVGNGAEVWELFCACASGDVEIVKRLVNANPSLVRSHYEYRTPLYFAVRENRMDVATFLLDRGANLFFNGDDLIDMARVRGLSDMQALLESKRPKFERILSPVQRLAQALRNSGASQAAAMIHDLLAPGSSCDIWTAAYVGNIDRVRELLDLDPSLVNRMGEDRSGTPLVTRPAAAIWKWCDYSWSVAPIPMFPKKAMRRMAVRSTRPFTTDVSMSPNFFLNTVRIRIRKWKAQRMPQASGS